MKFIWKIHTHNNLTIKLLKCLIQIIVFQISQFFVCMQINKSYMQVLFICYKMTAFWLIINLADLTSVLMLKLTDVEVSCDDLFSKTQKIWQITVRMNFVIIIQFFHQICTDIFKVFIITNINQTDIFDQVSNYFDMIKINKRNMLHFHFLIWLADNLEFHNLQAWLQNDAIYAARMIQYLKSIIKCFVDLTVENLENLKNQFQFSSVRESVTDSIFVH